MPDKKNAFPKLASPLDLGFAVLKNRLLMGSIRAPINVFKPGELTGEQVLETIEDFARTACLAREAGYDGVEIMGSEGYLINQFVVSRANQRTDEWGGSFENRADEINTCIGCNQACLDHIFENRVATCLVNPSACRETEFVFCPVARRKRIAVVGAGPAGLSFAVAAAGRGHETVLFEKAAG